MDCSTTRTRPRLRRCRGARTSAIAATFLIAPLASSQPCEWERLDGGGFSSKVWALTRFDAGGVPHLYAGGGFRQSSGSPASFIAGWDGSSWSGLGQGVGNGVKSLAVFDDGRGPGLFVGGAFGRAGEIPDANGVARWDGAEWSALGKGLYHEAPLSPHSAAALLGFDNGSGPALYVGGEFTHADGKPAINVARWNGQEWSALGDGLPGHEVRALAIFDDGSGPALYAGGYIAGGVARWDGQSWSNVGDRFVGYIDAMAVFDDGTGPALYAGGQMHVSSGHPGEGIARWDGERWTPLRGGVDYDVRSMHVFDDGTGPALYVGGAFHMADGKPVFGIAKWDGKEWHDLDGGVYGDGGISVDDMTIFDDGSGPALYVGGVDYDVRSMHVFDDGTGPALYVGGAFFKAGGREVRGIAKWDGKEWHELDGGMYHDRGVSVDALTTFDDGSGPALYVAGKFTAAGGPGGVPVQNIARWRCDSGCYADCDGDGELGFFDFLCFQNLFMAGDPEADCDGSGGHDFFDFLCFQSAFAAGCE
jgi:hypothetical protein